MELKRLAREKGTNLKKVAEKCGIPPSTLYAISRGDTNFDNVGIGTAIKVAETLGMTVEELYTGEAPAKTQPALTHDEQKLLGLFRKMDAQTRAKFVDMAGVFVAASEKYGDGAAHDAELAGESVRS